MNSELLRAIQHFTARAAIGSSSMRGAGSAGVVECARTFMGEMDLRPFGTKKSAQFLDHLDKATMELQGLLPKRARRWGRARKAVNIFLRNCLYTSYLCDEYGLGFAETFFELPLDSITGNRLVKESAARLPRWESVGGLTAGRSAQYQAAAAQIAEQRQVARVHLDAVWWGERAPLR